MHTLSIKATADNPPIYVHHNGDWSGDVIVSISLVGSDEVWTRTFSSTHLLTGVPLVLPGVSIPFQHGSRTAHITAADVLRLVTAHAVRAQLLGEFQAALDRL
jgi:hypothetical protein